MNKIVEMLLKINAIASSIALIGSVFVGASSVAVLLVASPFIPDDQEQIIKDFIAQTPVPICGSFGWLVGCAIAGVKLSQSEADPNDDLVEVARQKEAVLEQLEREALLNQCQTCHYHANDQAAVETMQHSCGLHPEGKPGKPHRCPDWEHFWTRYEKEHQVFASQADVGATARNGNRPVS